MHEGQLALAKTIKRKRFALAAAVAAPVTDKGPSIRLRDIVVPAVTRKRGDKTVVVSPEYIREADTVITRRPDISRPNSHHDVEVAVRWLPHRLYVTGKISKSQLGAASWFRDLMDQSEGISSAEPGQVGGTMPSRRANVTDFMLMAREQLRDACSAIGVNDTTLLRFALTERSISAVALSLGILPVRVGSECARALQLLDEWRVRYARGR